MSPRPGPPRSARPASTRPARASRQDTGGQGAAGHGADGRAASGHATGGRDAGGLGPGGWSAELSHTADLDAETRRAARELFDCVFGAEADQADWEHGLGGIHALVWEDGELVAHGSVVQRRLLHGGRALRAGYIEAVVVREDRRRRGHGAAVMDGLERVVRGAYELGALGATELGAALYVPRGWKPWLGETYALTPSGLIRTPDEDGNIYVLEVSAPLDPSAPLACDWRDGDVW